MTLVLCPRCSTHFCGYAGTAAQPHIVIMCFGLGLVLGLTGFIGLTVCLNPREGPVKEALAFSRKTFYCSCNWGF